jgi:exonuclease SbcD
VRTIGLTPKRPLVRIEGLFDDLLGDPRFAYAEGGLVEATYTDAGYVIDAVARLRRRFPHLLAALPKRLLEQIERSPGIVARANRDPSAVLEDFWQHVEGEPVGDEHRAAFLEMLGAGSGVCALAS